MLSKNHGRSASFWGAVQPLILAYGFPYPSKISISFDSCRIRILDVRNCLVGRVHEHI